MITIQKQTFPRPFWFVHHHHHQLKAQKKVEIFGGQ